VAPRVKTLGQLAFGSDIAAFAGRAAAHEDCGKPGAVLASVRRMRADLSATFVAKTTLRDEPIALCNAATINGRVKPVYRLLLVVAAECVERVIAALDMAGAEGELRDHLDELHASERARAELVQAVVEIARA
jgi:hypothetical protein